MFKATLTDAQRFAKYQSLITRLLAIDSFQKSDAFKNLPDEKKPLLGTLLMTWCGMVI